MESTVFPDCKKCFSFLPPPKWFVFSLCTVYTLSFCCSCFFGLCSSFSTFISPNGKKSSHISAALSFTVIEMIFHFCAFVFCLILHFLLVFCFFFGLKKQQASQGQPAVVHAKMNCVKNKLAQLFSFSVMDYF